MWAGARRLLLVCRWWRCFSPSCLCHAQARQAHPHRSPPSPDSAAAFHLQFQRWLRSWLLFLMMCAQSVSTVFLALYAASPAGLEPVKSGAGADYAFAQLEYRRNSHCQYRPPAHPPADYAHCPLLQICGRFWSPPVCTGFLPLCCWPGVQRAGFFPWYSAAPARR